MRERKGEEIMREVNERRERGKGRERMRGGRGERGGKGLLSEQISRIDREREREKEG